MHTFFRVEWSFNIMFVPKKTIAQKIYNFLFVYIQKVHEKWSKNAPFFMNFHGFDHWVHVFVVIHRRKFTRNYLDNDSDSEDAVKTKNALLFVNFSNICVTGKSELIRFSRNIYK